MSPWLTHRGAETNAVSMATRRQLVDLRPRWIRPSVAAAAAAAAAAVTRCAAIRRRWNTRDNLGSYGDILLSAGCSQTAPKRSPDLVLRRLNLAFVSSLVHLSDLQQRSKKIGYLLFLPPSEFCWN